MITEATPAKVKLSTLEEVHRQSGAAMVERDGWSVPASYGDLLFEYAQIRERGAGVSDLSSRGRLLVTGSEAVQFLNGLITNDMKTLAENNWMPAVFPNVQGRMLASVSIIHRPATAESPAGFLIVTEPATHARVLSTIQRFTLAGDFHVADLTEQTALISLRGTMAAEIIKRLFGEAAAALGQHQSLTFDWTESQLTVVRTHETAADGFDLIVAAPSAAVLWQSLREAGARPVGFDAFEMLRVEAGEPLFGLDMDETNVVSETGLDDAVSFTKGCYIGQEIIARIKYRGHVAKRLSGILFAGPASVARDAIISSTDGKEIGRLTSVSYSPHLGAVLALGYVKYNYLAPQTEVTVTSGAEQLPAQVIELPVVGSIN